MSPVEPASPDLSGVVRSERLAVKALIEALRAERQALDAGDTDALGHTAARKRELLLHIAHLGEHRNRVLERYGVSPDRRGMEQYLQADRGGACRREWQDLLEVTHQAQVMNRENGAFIDANMRANDQALSALTSAAELCGTYSSAGRTLTSPASRALASA